MKTGPNVVRVILATSEEFTSSEYVLLLGMFIVTCAAASHFMKELVP